MYKFIHGYPMSSTLVYMNWGWNGTDDGYYSYESLTPKYNTVYDNRYVERRRLILDINPK